jgi:hypothetical protein
MHVEQSLTLEAVDVVGNAPQTPAIFDIRIFGRDGSQILEEVGLTLPHLLDVPSEFGRFELTVKHADFVQVEVTIRFDRAGGRSWNNRGCHLTSLTSSSAILRIVLGRIRQSPIAEAPSKKTPGEQGGVFYPNGSPAPRSYLGMDLAFDHLKPVIVLKDQPGPPSTMLGDANLNDWGRFSTASPWKEQLRGKGGFLFLEYGGPGNWGAREPRFLLAVWVPDLATSHSTNGLDCVLFYTPSTATALYPESAYPYRNNYPYIATLAKDEANKDILIQPYIQLAMRYMFTNFALAPALHASARPALLVLPIFPHSPDKTPKDMWQPFNSQEGVHRMLLEIVHFLHAFGYGASGADFRGWQGASAPADGLIATPAPSVLLTQDSKAPEIRSLSIAAFSSGVSGLLPVLTNKGLVDTAKYKKELWSGSAKEFNDKWREIWCLDLTLDPKRTGFRTGRIDKDLAAWQASGNDRRIRIYHSGFTLTSRVALEYPTFDKRQSSTVTSVTSNAAASLTASDRRDADGKSSLIFCSTSYLRAVTAPTGSTPSFPQVSEGPIRVHPFMAEIAFGHAASLRSS